jgi:hypothetical protein
MPWFLLACVLGLSALILLVFAGCSGKSEAGKSTHAAAGSGAPPAVASSEMSCCRAAPAEDLAQIAVPAGGELPLAIVLGDRAVASVSSRPPPPPVIRVVS